jgi:hypothetical protein
LYLLGYDLIQQTSADVRWQKNKKPGTSGFPNVENGLLIER